MATINQIQTGLAKFIDEEIVASMQGWQKWVFGGGITVAVENLPATINKMKDYEWVKMLGVIDNGNNVDVAKIYQGVKRQAAKGPITVDLPVGMGKLTLNEADVDKLYRYITGM